MIWLLSRRSLVLRTNTFTSTPWCKKTATFPKCLSDPTAISRDSPKKAKNPSHLFNRIRRFPNIKISRRRIFWYRNPRKVQKWYLLKIVRCLISLDPNLLIKLYKETELKRVIRVTLLKILKLSKHIGIIQNWNFIAFSISLVRQKPTKNGWPWKKF